jgi:hypothetical protein
MDVERQPDGHWHFKLGPVERWVVAALATLLMIALGLIFTSVTGELKAQGQRQDETNKTLQTVVTQQAVANGQMATLSAQLADVPALTRQMAEIRVRVDRHDEDIKELRQVRGLR